MKGTNSIKIETPFEGDDTVYYINGGRTFGKVNKLVDDMIKVINDLKQENQQLRIEISAIEEDYKKLENNWNDLKEYIEEHNLYYKKAGLEMMSNMLNGIDIINKMEELERGVSDVG